MRISSTKLNSLFSAVLVLGLAIAGNLPVSQAQRPSGDSPAKESEKGSAEQKSTPDKEAETDSNTGEKKKDIIAIVGGDIMTVTRETIRGGTILIENGKITALGNNVDVPEGATQIDASGKVITPGFVALEVSGVGLNPPSERNAKYSDSLDPFDRNVSLSLGVGITTGCVEIRSGGGGRRRRSPDEDFPITERFPGLDPDIHELQAAQEQTERDYGEFIAVCKCCGLPILPTEPIEPTPPTPITPQKNAVIKMSYGKLDGMLITENAFLDVTPGSLSGSMNQRNWREQIGKARKYIEDQVAHEKATAAGKKEQPPRKPVSDEVLRLVMREIALRIAANSVSDIRDMVQLSKELEYKLVITGAAEAWAIPSEIAEAEVGVVITPRNRRAATFGAEDSSGTWIETPRVLEETGVPFAVTALSSSISLNGLAGRDLTSLPLEAAFAVRGGASERKALEAITIAPARMLGLDKRIGSLEVGKDADLLLLNGHPLDYRTYVETAIVNGRIAYERSSDRVLPVYDR